MSRLLTLLCFLAIAVIISAVPVYVGPFDLPVRNRFKRQFGFGMPFGGYGGAYGNSYGFSESESFNMYNTGFNTGYFG